MEERKEREFFEVEHLPPHSGNADFAFQERLCGPVAEGADNFRADQGNLFQEKWLAGVDFLRFGITIVGWATLDHIGDVDIPPRQASRLEQLIE